MVLLIEDNTDICESFAELLMLEGYEVKTADCGTVGAKLALELLPDVIICDILMPGLDGFQVLNTLRRNKYTHDIPFIFSTSSVGKADIQKGLDMGAKYFFTKPFDELAVFDAIRNCLAAKAPKALLEDLP